MTIEEILTQVQERKPCSLPSLYRYLSKLNIKPVQAPIQTRPRQYADDTAARVLSAMGLNGTPLQTQPRIVSMAELKAERSRARQARQGRRAK